MSHSTPPREILAQHQIDDIAMALIALTREVWVLSDRQAMLEKLLADHGIDCGEIDTMQPDEALEAELAVKRDRLLSSVIDALRNTSK
jgi:hypothetical protein